MLKIYNALSSKNIERIHAAAIEVLETVGLRLNHPVALERLAGAGGRVDKSKAQVRLTADMVASALKATPQSFNCAGRSPEFDLTVEARATTAPMVRSAAGAIQLYDFFKDEPRPLTLDDCRDVAILVDALDHIDMVSCPAPPKAPENTYDLSTLKILLESGRKHIWALPKDSKNLSYQMEMMKTVAGGSEALRQRPLCSGIVCLLEPLRFPSDEIDRLLQYGEVNLPVKVPLVPMMGANAPYTFAGAMTQTHAEALGTLVLLQTLFPGIPSWYYILLHDMEMRTGHAHYLSPETMMVTAGLIQLARHYGIPSSASAFMTSDSQAHQVMFTRGAALTLYALSGVTEIGAAGAVEGGVGISPIALSIDDELIAHTRRVVEGFKIDQDTLAVEAIQQVGFAGDFMSADHTFKYLRREYRFQPTLLDWRPHSLWKKEGDTLLERARDRCKHILATHTVPPLEVSMQAELDRILQTAEMDPSPH